MFTPWSPGCGMDGKQQQTGVPLARCQHCGGMHETFCPRIKAIDYYADGSIKRVEYFEDYGAALSYGPTS